MKQLSKFRVQPGLSLTSADLARRRRLNQEIPISEGVYVMDELGIDIRRMSKIDIDRERLANGKRIEELKASLQNSQSSKPIPKPSKPNSNEGESQENTAV